MLANIPTTDPIIKKTIKGKPALLETTINSGRKVFGIIPIMETKLKPTDAICTG
jgi:hypothetical protein